MTTLAEFVEARLTERWEQAHRDVGFYEADCDSTTDKGAESRALWIVHTATDTIDRIKAQRRTLARHASCGYGTGYCDDGGHGWDDGPSYGCSDLADLAAPDHEHPDFNPAWALT